MHRDREGLVLGDPAVLGEGALLQEQLPAFRLCPEGFRWGPALTISNEVHLPSRVRSRGVSRLHSRQPATCSWAAMWDSLQLPVKQWGLAT